MSTPQEDIKPYLHPFYGVVCNVPHITQERMCDNYHLFSAYWVNVLFQRALDCGQDFRDDYQVFYESCVVAPGLINRYPKYYDLTSHDELIGAAYLSWAHAYDIYEYGSDHEWSWNNSVRGMFLSRAWYRRFIGFIPYLKGCSSKSLSIKDQVLFSLDLLLSLRSPKQDTSGKLLKYLQVSRMRNVSWIIRMVTGHWQKRMMVIYPGGIQEVAAIYFGNDHPITKYARLDFNIRRTS